MTAQWAKKMTQKEINPQTAYCAKISFLQASVGLSTPRGQVARSKHKWTLGARSPIGGNENSICSLMTSLEHTNKPAIRGYHLISHAKGAGWPF